MLARILAGLLALSGPALADQPIPRGRPLQPRPVPPCADLSIYHELLLKDYGEAPKSIALLAGGGLIAIYTSREGTFTVLNVSPQHYACVAGIGRAWEDIPETARSRWLDPEM